MDNDIANALVDAIKAPQMHSDECVIASLDYIGLRIDERLEDINNSICELTEAVNALTNVIKTKDT